LLVRRDAQRATGGNMPKFSIKRAFFGLTSALVLTASLGAFAQTDAPNPRIALVIGNAAYPIKRSQRRRTMRASSRRHCKPQALML